MSYRGHAFVDWDDTIAENIRYFHEAEQFNSQLIASVTGIDADRVRHRGEELDVAVARRLGLVRETLSLAWTECYYEFCALAGVAADPTVLARVREACEIPYETRQDLLPGAAETLGWLRQEGYEITIWTAGDQEVQSRKISQSGLESLIHRKRIVVDKTPERLRDALGDRSPVDSFVVGNSAHSDIFPALALGLPAFHIDVKTWAYDRTVLDAGNPNYVRLSTIFDLPLALQSRIRTAG